MSHATADHPTATGERANGARADWVDTVQAAPVRRPIDYEGHGWVVGRPMNPSATAEQTDPTKPDHTPRKAVAALVVVNALAVYGQLAYAMEHIAPTGWPLPARVALSVGFAAAVESVALYVGWHAHDALLNKGYATARRLRRWSFLIAASVGAMNYAHFAAPGMRPTAAACAFGLLSLMSPWMWGLHTRRQQHLQLIKERKVDETGAEFSSERRRHFPFRTLAARRWSIDHNVSDPLAAWSGYKTDRVRRAADEARAVRLKERAKADKKSGPDPAGKSVSRRVKFRLRTRLSDRKIRVFTRPEKPTAIQADVPVSGPTDVPVPDPTENRTVDPTADLTSDRNPDPTETPNRTLNGSRVNGRKSTPKHTPTAIRNAGLLRGRYGDRLTLPIATMRAEMGGWSYDRITPAIAAHKAKADLTQSPNGATP